MAAVRRSDQALTAVILGMTQVINGVFPNIPSGLVILTYWVMSSA